MTDGVKAQGSSGARAARRLPVVLLVAAILAWIGSGISLVDTRLTWFLETLPFLIALPVLLFTYRRFPLSNLAYVLIAVHAAILMVGGHYSYAKVPLGFWMESWFGWTRNNYDKIGHLMQGLGPAIYTREILLRTTPLGRGKMLTFVSISVPMAISALYEIAEWLASLSNPADTEAFLGTQGYIWDSQSDMFFCLVGAVAALLLLSRLHDRSLARIGAH